MAKQRSNVVKKTESKQLSGLLSLGIPIAVVGAVLLLVVAFITGLVLNPMLTMHIISIIVMGIFALVIGLFILAFIVLGSVDFSANIVAEVARKQGKETPRWVDKWRTS